MILLAPFSGLLAYPLVAVAAQPFPTPQEDEAEEAVEEPVDPEWTGSIDLGFMTTSGNTDITTTNANANAQKETEKDRWTLRANYALTEEDGDKTQEKMGGGAQYDYFLEEDWYLFANLTADKDKIANLDLRARAGVGVGHQVWDEEKRKLAVEAGLNYTVERYDVDEDSEDEDEQEFVSAILAVRYEQQIREDSTFASDLELYPSLEDSDDFTARWDNRLRVDMTENMFVQAQAVFDYDNSPVNDNDELDGRYIFGLGWTF